MTRNDEFIDQLEDYLEHFDGPTPLPDRVRDALEAVLPETRQVRPRPGSSREPNMRFDVSTITRWGLVAAGFVVALAFGGMILMPGGAGGNAAASATPTVAPTPTPPPTASPIPVALDAAPSAPCPGETTVGCVAPGTYRIPGGLLVDVPAGWFTFDAGAGSIGLLVDRRDAPDGSGWGMVVSEIGTVNRDPCDPTAGTYRAADVDTPAKLVAAMAKWPGFTVTPAETISIAGLAAVRTQVTSTVPGSACAAPGIWTNAIGSAVDPYPMTSAVGGAAPYPADFRILSVPGHLVAIRTMASARTAPNEAAQGVAEDPTRHAADLVILDRIVASFRKDPTGA